LRPANNSPAPVKTGNKLLFGGCISPGLAGRGNPIVPPKGPRVKAYRFNSLSDSRPHVERIESLSKGMDAALTGVGE
jgi:hypothetical protein